MMLRLVSLPEDTEFDIPCEDSPVVLGRGPLLQITDANVSRKQAVLEFDRATQKWGFTSVKKCLYSNSHGSAGSWRELHPLESVQVNDADAFSLLDESAASFSVSLLARNTGECDRKRDCDAIRTRERTLPSWMMNYPSPSKKTKLGPDSPRKGKTAGKSPRPVRNEVRQAADKKISSPVKSTEGAGKLQRGEGEEAKHQLSDSEDEHEQKSKGGETREQTHQMSDSEGEDIEDKGGKREPAMEMSESGEEKEEEPSGTKRDSCVFGSGCYRKNPQHREEVAHPGDGDYEDKNEDDAADGAKPACEYGPDCYRKNPQHLRDFDHTRKRRLKRRAKGGGKQDDDDDDGSFIDDDGSSEPGDITSEEEEEWLPDSDSN